METTGRSRRSRQLTVAWLVPLLSLGPAVSISRGATLPAKALLVGDPAPGSPEPRAPQTQPSSPSTQPTGAEAGKTESHGHPSHANHRFTDTERYIKMFEDPARAEYQKPKEVVEALRLRPGQTVADIGAGSGYFSFLMARAVGPEGTVYAVDIEPGMIDYMKVRAKKEGAANVRTILARPDDPGLPPRSIDLVFICNTWHHIEDRVGYARRLKGSLEPEARVAIVDYQKRPLPVGPRVEDKIDRADIVTELKTAGYVLVQEPEILPYQYFLIFAPAAP